MFNCPTRPSATIDANRVFVPPTMMMMMMRLLLLLADEITMEKPEFGVAFTERLRSAVC